ncbi:hypothetical protein MUDAN_BIHEEGNE_03381 [Lactiplantibacillus mudanjiangensis]|nr:hypothetical protein MUDAN_BIHEEGNE_03381 [Lactiplantibacillus mudanjiangensis]
MSIEVRAIMVERVSLKDDNGEVVAPYTTADAVGGLADYLQDKCPQLIPDDPNHIRLTDAEGTAWLVGISTDGKLTTTKE